MRQILGVGLLLVMLGAGMWAQAAAVSPQESSSRTAPEVPTPPDAPVPDLGQQTSPPPKSKAKKVASKFDPHCIDVIFHACWSSPPAAPNKVLTDEEKQAQLAAKDIDVGFYYLNEKNYVAAESRLKEAVELKPDATPAYIGLGQAQQKLGKTADARQSYEAFLKLTPDSPDADKVRKALAGLGN
jgi:tetratricopeptide (TPR) repeat protein